MSTINVSKAKRSALGLQTATESNYNLFLKRIRQTEPCFTEQ